ncbi:MAG: dihydroorotase [Lachnospiraceae bacterium]|nr:dihydroorotase [Lachnospiraceae bacterium]
MFRIDHTLFERIPASIPDTGILFSLGKDDSREYTVLPGFCDVHVHLREPGFSYKETVRTGTLSAARGGFTDVCAMPNIRPVPDSVPHLSEELALIARDTVIRVHPYGSLTVNEEGEEPADLPGMAPYVCAFSDDGKGVQSEDMMRKLMIRAKMLGKIVTAHCEVNELVKGGVIHEGAYAKAHGYPGISSESEWKMIERDLRLAKETGAAYHVCHISAKESVELIRKAKRDGVDVTCETAPHYLVMTDEDLQEDGQFKMNPPIRGREDREALAEGILDGTIDMIITDHAPHSAEEKAKGLLGSAFGIVGLETSFPVMYTHFVRPGVLSMEKLMDLMAVRPRKRFGLPFGNDFSVWDLEAPYRIDPAEFLSKGKATPFTGMEVYGRCIATVCDGKTVYTAE